MHNSFDFCGYVSVQLMDRNVLCLLLIYLLQGQQYPHNNVGLPTTELNQFIILIKSLILSVGYKISQF